ESRRSRTAEPAWQRRGSRSLQANARAFSLKPTGQETMIASYSFLRDLENCPHKAYRKYLVRDLPKEDSPELREGIITHKLFEDYINGASGRLPVELESHAK